MFRFPDSYTVKRIRVNGKDVPRWGFLVAEEALACYRRAATDMEESRMSKGFKVEPGKRYVRRDGVEVEVRDEESPTGCFRYSVYLGGKFRHFCTEEGRYLRNGEEDKNDLVSEVGLRIEEGRLYRRRDGSVVRYRRIREDENPGYDLSRYPFAVAGKDFHATNMVSKDGRYWHDGGEHRWDAVEEVKEGNEMQLKDGYWYRDRQGEEVRVEREREEHVFNWYTFRVVDGAHLGCGYTDEGWFYPDEPGHALNLVEELGVKVEEGKLYRTRGGEEVRVRAIPETGEYAFEEIEERDGLGWHYRLGWHYTCWGRIFTDGTEHSADIVAEEKGEVVDWTKPVEAEEDGGVASLTPVEGAVRVFWIEDGERDGVVVVDGRGEVLNTAQTDLERVRNVEEKAYDAEDLRAAEDSLQHWERLAAGTQKEGESTGDSDCALCGIYYDTNCVEGGKKCPLYTMTGVPGCGSREYKTALAAKDIYGLGSASFRAAAGKMARLLKEVVEGIRSGELKG